MPHLIPDPDQSPEEQFCLWSAPGLLLTVLSWQALLVITWGWGQGGGVSVRGGVILHSLRGLLDVVIDHLHGDDLLLRVLPGVALQQGDTVTLLWLLEIQCCVVILTKEWSRGLRCPLLLCTISPAHNNYISLLNVWARSTFWKVIYCWSRWWLFLENVGKEISANWE